MGSFANSIVWICYVIEQTWLTVCISALFTGSWDYIWCSTVVYCSEIETFCQQARWWQSFSLLWTGQVVALFFQTVFFFKVNKSIWVYFRVSDFIPPKSSTLWVFIVSLVKKQQHFVSGACPTSSLRFSPISSVRWFLCLMYILWLLGKHNCSVALCYFNK